MGRKRIVNGKIVDADSLPSSPQQQDAPPDQRHFTQQGASSATQQIYPGGDAIRPQTNARHMPQVGDQAEFSLTNEMDVFGYQLKVWQILCVVGLSVYAAGPMALLAFGGLFYMNRQRQPQIGAQAAPAPNASASASGHRPTSYRGNVQRLGDLPSQPNHQAPPPSSAGPPPGGASGRSGSGDGRVPFSGSGRSLN